MSRKYPKPKVGDKYGKWTVVSVPSEPVWNKRITCRCSCGRIISVRYDTLTQGRSTCCAVCRQIKWQAAIPLGIIARTKYDFVPVLHRRRLQCCVKAAIYRCHIRPHKNYGGRGIAVYPAWRKDRTLFMRYLMTLPGWDDPILEIDRIDNNGNYEPGNLQFVTRSANNLNKVRGAA